LVALASSNPWLSGFIESDGNFYCEFKLNEGIATLIKCYMRISQKQSYKSTTTISKDKASPYGVAAPAQGTNYYLMDKIREFLDVKNVTLIQRNKPNYIELAYEVRTTKILSCDILINY